jgi:putative protein-disulfide isomerase
MTDEKILYYVHDPMCSWCWGFSKTWQQVTRALDGLVEIRYVLGGLAPDSRDPMPAAMQQMLQDTWRNIQTHIPGTDFNFDFWTENEPRRSTYPACRAVLAARAQNPHSERAMISAIQQAYYLNACNPSNDSVLIDLAGDLKLDRDQFAESLNNAETQLALLSEIQFGQQLGAHGFPSMVLKTNGARALLRLDYNSADNIIRQIL